MSRFQVHPVKWMGVMWFCVLYSCFMMEYVMSTVNPLGALLASFSVVLLVFTVFVTVLVAGALWVSARRRCK